jgi:phosphoribosylanthranilate isomerase
MYKPRVKICCISSVEEGALAVRYGASAVGLVSDMPSGPGTIPEELITEIARTIPPSVATFLLTSKLDAPSMIEQQRKTRVNTLQLVDAVHTSVYRELRDALHGVSLVQVIHVRGNESVDEALSVVQYVDVLLLDSGNPLPTVKELGGTGRTHDWSISRKIRDAVKIPVYLAGGLKAENVRRAIETVQPFGVDVCNGVRSNGKLNDGQLKKFFAEVNSL